MKEPEEDAFTACKEEAPARHEDARPLQEEEVVRLLHEKKLEEKAARHAGARQATAPSLLKDDEREATCFYHEVLVVFKDDKEEAVRLHWRQSSAF